MVSVAASVPISSGEDSARGKRANMLRDQVTFTVDDLICEFEEEKQSVGLAKVTEDHVTRRQRRLRRLERKLMDMTKIENNLDRPAYVRDLPCHNFVTAIISSSLFQMLFYSLVVVYSISMGIEMELDDPSWDEWWMLMNGGFAFAFFVEVVLKLYSFGHSYFQVPWFILEFMTTLAALANLAMLKQGIASDYRTTTTVLKCSRIILLSKLFSMREEFQIIILGFTRSFRSLSGVLFVLIVICYGCTLFCYNVIGKKDYSDYEDPLREFTHKQMFGSIPRTMLTMFCILVIDDWAAIARAVYEMQTMVVLFFVVFTVLVTFGMLNVVTGIIVDTVNGLTQEHQELEQEQGKYQQRQKLEQVVEKVFHTGDGHEIDLLEFKEHGRSEELMDMMDLVDFPLAFTVEDLFTLLDTTGHRKIIKAQFVDGIMRLIYSTDFHRDCQAMLSLNIIRRDIVAMRKELRVMHRTLNSTHKATHGGSATMNGEDEYADLQSQPSRASLKQQYSQIPNVAVEEKLVEETTFPQFPVVHNDGRSETPRNWEQLHATLHAAATQYCRKELQKAWEALERCYQSMDVHMGAKKAVTPKANISGSNLFKKEERFYVFNKLCGAVYNQSFQDLVKALDHARAANLSEQDLAILLTYRDALARTQSSVGFSMGDLNDALMRGNWSGALNMVVEASLAQGADKQLLTTALARLCAESSVPTTWQKSDMFPSCETSALATSTSTQRRGEGVQSSGGSSQAAISLNTITLENVDQHGRLIVVLHREALQNAAKELQAAWEDLDINYADQDRFGGSKGGFGPGYEPFSKREEVFFIWTQINNAVRQKSASELRRALSHALDFGMDPRRLEFETAYRDALFKYHNGVGFDPIQITDPLARGDWWSAIDELIAASAARGLDKHMLLKMLARVSTVNTTLMPKVYHASV